MHGPAQEQGLPLARLEASLANEREAVSASDLYLGYLPVLLGD
jgi:hypothetical protein